MGKLLTFICDEYNKIFDQYNDGLITKEQMLERCAELHKKIGLDEQKERKVPK